MQALHTRVKSILKFFMFHIYKRLHLWGIHNKCILINFEIPMIHNHEVPGSIPGLATANKKGLKKHQSFFVFQIINYS